MTSSYSTSNLDTVQKLAESEECAGQVGKCVHVRGGEEGDPAEEPPVPAGRLEGDVYQEMEMGIF